MGDPGVGSSFAGETRAGVPPGYLNFGHRQGRMWRRIMPRRRWNAPGPAQEVQAPMQAPTRPRRPAGTGSLLVRTDRAGRRSWYGKFRVGPKQVKRRLGRVREPGSSLGLTQTQANRELRRMIAEVEVAPPPDVRVLFAEAADRYLAHV